MIYTLLRLILISMSASIVVLLCIHAWKGAGFMFVAMAVVISLATLSCCLEWRPFEIKRFLWNLRFCYYLIRLTGIGFKNAWACATADDTSFNEGETPKEAVEIEVSYWDDDEAEA